MVYWLLWASICYGTTGIVTGSKLFKWLRQRLSAWEFTKDLIHCPRCFGWWVGFVLSWLGVGPAYECIVWWPRWLVAMADGTASSAICWIVHVVLVRLGSKDL